MTVEIDINCYLIRAFAQPSHDNGRHKQDTSRSRATTGRVLATTDCFLPLNLVALVPIFPRPVLNAIS
jgi:hypothetical protein